MPIEKDEKGRNMYVSATIYVMGGDGGESAPWQPEPKPEPKPAAKPKKAKKAKVKKEEKGQ